MRLRCGDVQMELAVLDKSDAYFISDKMVAYRRTAASATGNPLSNFCVGRDGILVRYAYAKIKGLCYEQDSIMKWYINYMAEAGFQFLPYSTWLDYFRKSDKKVVVIKRILVGSSKRVIKQIIRRLRNKAENV